MKTESKLTYSLIIAILIISALFTACKSPEKFDSVESNIKMYTSVWDEIINNGKLDMFNDSNFTKNLILHEGTIDVVGIDSARAYYANYLTGFSNIQFTIKDVFGQDNKIVKYWNFKGTHSALFFGIPATGKTVNIDGVTLVRMQDGKIAEERDFIDNLDFMTQLGLVPAIGE